MTSNAAVQSAARAVVVADPNASKIVASASLKIELAEP